MRQLSVGEVDLCVDEYGDPAAPLVLLLSGAAASMDWWDIGLCEAIAAGGRRVARFDYRDTGQSTTGKPGKPAYGGEAHEQDVIGLIEAIDGAPAHLVGISMGGGIAQSVALHRPDLVASLTLVATTAVGGVDAALPPPEPALASTFETPPPDPDWSDRDGVIEWFLVGEHLLSGSTAVDEERVRTIAGGVFDRSNDPAAAGNHWLVIGGEDGEPLDARAITVPTLVVHGTHDPLFPLPHGEALAAAIPGARLLTVSGMGHQVPPAPTWPEFVRAVLALDQSRSNGSA